jgi:putative flippase GtrA
MSFVPKNLIKFFIAGGAAASANIVSRVLLSSYFSYKISIFISFIIGLTVAFFLMKRFVFASGDALLSVQIKRFTIVNLVTLLCTILISVNLNNFLLLYLTNKNITEAIAHFIGVIFPIFTSYFVHKFFTFN